MNSGSARQGRPRVLGWLLVAVAAGVLAAPILMVFSRAFVEAPQGIWPLIVEVLGESRLREVAVRTTMLAVLAGGLSTIMGAALSWLLTRSDLPARRPLQALVIVPFFMPSLVVAFAWVTLTGPRRGLINQLFANLGLSIQIQSGSFIGMALILSLAITPIAYLLLRGAVAKGAADEEEAAMAAGASTWTILRTISLPLLFPSIASTYIVMFVLAAANFSVTGVIGIPARLDVLTTDIFFSMKSYPPDHPRAALIGSVMVIVLGSLIAVQRRMGNSTRYASGRSTHREAPISALGRLRYPAFLMVCLYLLVALILPIGALGLASLLPYWGAPLSELTFDNYGRLFGSQEFIGSTVNTVVLALVGATVITVWGAAVALVVVRSRAPGARMLDVAASAPLGLPGIILGLGFLWLFVGTPFYGTLFLVILALTVKFSPFGIRSVSSAVVAIHSDLDHAARVAGASEIQVMYRILIPQLTQTLLSVWILAFLLLTHEVDTNILLAGAGNSVLSVTLFSWWQHGAYERAAATAMTLLAIVAVVLSLAGVVLRHRRMLLTSLVGPGQLDGLTRS